MLRAAPAARGSRSAGSAPGAAMFATSTTSCIETSTRCGRPRPERGQRRERGLAAGVRVAGRLGAAHRRAVGIAGAVHVAARRHARRGRTRATPRAGPSSPNGVMLHPDRVRRASRVERRARPGSPGVSITTSARRRAARRAPGRRAARRRPTACPRSTRPSGRVARAAGRPPGGSTQHDRRRRGRRARGRPSRPGSPARSTTRRPSSSRCATGRPRRLATVPDVRVSLRCAIAARATRRQARAMSEHRIVDADCHILEPPDIWTNWLPDEVPGQGAEAREGPRGRRRVAHRGRRRPRPDRARVDAGHAVRQVPLVRRDLRGGAHRLLQRRGAPRGHGHRRRRTPRSCSRRSAR